MSKIFSFEDKVIEYFVKVSEIGRNITENDNYTFSNGDNMHEWYNKQNIKLNKELSLKKISKNRLYNIMLLAKLDNYIFDLSKKKEKDFNKSYRLYRM